jgi:serine/threonine protein kinase
MNQAVVQTDVDRYVIVEYLAEGGMGAIYLGKKVGMGGFEKEVVLKQLLPEFTSQPEFIDLFLREAKLSASLDHANIVHTIDLVAAGNDYFIVMEYVRGGDMRAILRRVKRRGQTLSPGATLFIAREVLNALAYAHDKRDSQGNDLKLIHRDISPSNVMISAAGEVKLADFGIAKVSTHKSVFYRVKGKVGYMSPEQAYADRPIDHRSDLYSLGICFYEMLTGERLFVADLLSTPDQIYSQKPAALESQRGMPRGLDRLLDKALAFDPERRFQDAAEMQDALMRLAFDNGLMFTAPDLGAELRDKCGEDPSQWNLDEEEDPPQGSHPGTELLGDASRSFSVPAASDKSVDELSNVELTSVLTADQLAAPQAAAAPFSAAAAFRDAGALDDDDPPEEPTRQINLGHLGADGGRSHNGVEEGPRHAAMAYEPTRLAKARAAHPSFDDSDLDEDATEAASPRAFAGYGDAPPEVDGPTDYWGNDGVDDRGATQAREGFSTQPRRDRGQAPGASHRPAYDIVDRPMRGSGEVPTAGRYGAAPGRGAASFPPIPRDDSSQYRDRRAPAPIYEDDELALQSRYGEIQAGADDQTTLDESGSSTVMVASGLRAHPYASTPPGSAPLADPAPSLSFGELAPERISSDVPPGAALLRRAGDAREATYVSREERPRNRLGMLVAAAVLVILAIAIVAAIGLSGPDFDEDDPARRGGAPEAPDTPAARQPSPPAKAPGAKSPAATSQVKAELVLSSSPSDASVFVDSERRERCYTPCTVKLRRGRTHLLSVRRRRYVSWSKLVHLASKTKRLRAYLSEELDASAVGHLVINATPAADVHVDGKAIGRVTSDGRIALKPGHYQIELSRPEKRRKRRFSVRIRHGQTLRLNKRL